MGAYVAFPDLRGAEEHESWMDMERMGIAPDARFMAMPPGGYYRPEDMGMDPYAIYPMEQPAPGPDPGYMPYGAPLPAEFAPYERQYDGRGSGQHASVTAAPSRITYLSRATRWWSSTGRIVCRAFPPHSLFVRAKGQPEIPPSKPR
jgi:hypothetical protein